MEEVNAFCFLTPYLHRFIPGHAESVTILKKMRGKELPAKASSETKRRALPSGP
jgi:hypothetical protein